MLKFDKYLLQIVAFLMGFLLISSKAHAAASTERLAGSDRYETSVKISQDSWSQSDYVVLVSGENFPDGLSAAPLAKKYNAPILLSPKMQLDSKVFQEIKRLNVKKVFIVGGPGVISPDVETTLNSLDISVTRLYGQNRYETSLRVAEVIGTANGAFICSGENFPDTLSVASIAASKQMPILFSTSSYLPASVKEYIDNNSIDNFYIIGGSGAIGDSIVSSLKNAKRLYGLDRYSTNTAILNEFSKDINFNNIYFASGKNFPDALSGSAAAAKDSSVIVLTDGYYCSSKSILKANMDSIITFKLLGGTSIIPDLLIQKILDTSKTFLGYSTYYSSSDKSSYNTIVNHSSSIDEIATDTFHADKYGNLSGLLPTAQLDYAKNNDISTLAVVSNYFSGDTAKNILESSTNRTNLINNILEVLVEHGYNGVNIDIEGIYYYDREYFSTFMKELYNTLHPLGFEVTVAVPAKTRDSITDAWSGAFDYSEIGKVSDMVVLMTYDEHWSGGTAGPIASIDWVQKVANYALTVIPKEKILLGIASYAYDWPSNGEKADAYGIQEAYSVADKYNAVVKWDSISKSPYYNYVDSSGISHTVWFENSTSIGYKLDIVNNLDLSGAAMWRLGLENSDFWTSIAAKLD